MARSGQHLSVISWRRCAASSAAAETLGLNRGTRHGSVGAEHAALTFKRRHAVGATPAIISVETGVGRHKFNGLVTAGRTSDERE